VIPPEPTSIRDLAPPVRRAATIQLGVGALLGVMQASLTEPRRAWRFLLLAAAAVLLVVIYDRVRRLTHSDAWRQQFTVPMVLMFVSWGIVGFVITSVRLMLR
jgi:hypothetical protein